MGYNVKILKDSLAPSGVRLTTWELTYPRFVHAELMTHRVFSRNSASSRAIPTSKLIERIKQDPALPQSWGLNQQGMQAWQELSNDIEYKDGIPTCFAGYGTLVPCSPRAKAMEVWLEARDVMVKAAEKLNTIGLHKQIANRVVEPWMFITVIVSATYFENWFHLRLHKDAQPEIAWVAREMYCQYQENVPEQLEVGDWHLPLIDDEKDWEDAGDLVIKQHAEGDYAEWDDIVDVLKKVSVGRCARVSYLTHDGKRDIQKDIELHDKLCSGPQNNEPGHWSPFEHVAVALNKSERHGNFHGWKQYRKFFPKEHFGGEMP